MFIYLLSLFCFYTVTSLQRKKDKRDNVPIIYMVTPTHSCLTQKADLTRLCHTLMHVTNLHWIVVEDSVEKTSLVTCFLARFVIVNKCQIITVYHERFEAEKFHGFHAFIHVSKTFLYESSRWRCSSMDLR